MVEKKNNIIKKILGILTRGLFIGVFLLVVVIVVQGFQNPDKAPSILGYQPLTVLSNSMYPTFETGDLIIVQKTDPTKIIVDDVVTFQEESGTSITHRVIDVVNDQKGLGFLTKGDNNNIVDEQIVRAGMIEGVSTFHIPNLGFIANFAGGPAGFILLIILPLLGYLTLEIMERFKKVAVEN